MKAPAIPVTPPAISPTLEGVRQQFETWRKRRRCRSQIPEALWQRAVELCREHSVWEICRALRLNYSNLRGRVQESRGRSPALGQGSDVGFVRLGFGTSVVPSECLVEMEAPNGAKMRMSIRGTLKEVDPVELGRAFWRQGR
jgi:hypothetical protein